MTSGEEEIELPPAYECPPPPPYVAVNVDVEGEKPKWTKSNSILFYISCGAVTMMTVSVGILLSLLFPFKTK